MTQPYDYVSKLFGNIQGVNVLDASMVMNCESLKEKQVEIELDSKIHDKSIY